MLAAFAVHLECKVVQINVFFGERQRLRDAQAGAKEEADFNKWIPRYQVGPVDPSLPP